VVKNAWKHADRHEPRLVSGNLKEVAGELKDWSRTSVGDLEKCIARTKRDLETCRHKYMRPNAEGTSS
jgi:hypothetical protein